jgi:hypothetical protein
MLAHHCSHTSPCYNESWPTSLQRWQTETVQVKKISAFPNALLMPIKRVDCDKFTLRAVRLDFELSYPMEGLDLSEFAAAGATCEYHTTTQP